MIKSTDKLSKIQQKAILRAIHLAKIRYTELILDIAPIREYCISLWWTRYSKGLVGYRNVSTAKLSEAYNSSVRGLNAELEESINEKLLCAKRAEHEGQYDLAKSLLIKAKLHPKVYFDQIIREGIIRYAGQENRQAKRALVLLKGIDRRRHTLLYSVVRMLKTIIKNKLYALMGNRLGSDDLFQELVSKTYEATLINFDYNADVLWSSYIYSLASKTATKVIAEGTRIVALPRTTLDRFSIVRAAIKKVGVEDIEYLTEEVNAINRIRKKALNRGVKKSEIYSSQEIVQLLKDTLSYSTRRSFYKGEFKEESDAFSLSIYQEKENSQAVFLDKVKEVLYPLEWEVLSLRWGLTKGEICYSFEEILKQLNTTQGGRRFSKNKVQNLEREALKRLKELKNSTLKEFWENLGEN